ncbi:uncharacterized protein LOC141918633 isoform X2 [Strix aluco]|uniref:uncharacterized protein LOC141918633 isoform X2 n=2 Tax=Strix aluco TaxID=111821 RepID=UPI003DA2CE10
MGRDAEPRAPAGGAERGERSGSLDAGGGEPAAFAGQKLRPGPGPRTAPPVPPPQPRPREGGAGKLPPPRPAPSKGVKRRSVLPAPPPQPPPASAPPWGPPGGGTLARPLRGSSRSGVEMEPRGDIPQHSAAQTLMDTGFLKTSPFIGYLLQLDPSCAPSRRSITTVSWCRGCAGSGDPAGVQLVTPRGRGGGTARSPSGAPRSRGRGREGAADFITSLKRRMESSHSRLDSWQGRGQRELSTLPTDTISWKFH